MFLGVVGSRRRNSPEDKDLIREQIELFLVKYDKVVLVSGGCPRGADRFAEEIAKEKNLEILLFLPDLTGCKQKWEFVQKYYMRDKLIAEQSDCLIACVALDRKGGTEKTIKEFQKLRVFKKDSQLILI